MFSPCSLSARSIQKWAAEDLQYGLKTSLRRCAITTRTGASVNSFAMYACRPSECTEQLMKPVRVVARQIWRESGLSLGRRSIPEETAVALTYNGGTYAVMMTTPQDFEDFAVGFSLSEGVISSSADIDSLDIVRSITASSYECGSVNQRPIVCRSDGGILR